MTEKERNWQYMAPFEVVIHNKPEDCWVSLLGKVFDITPMIKKYEGKACIKPLISLAGKDLSHWFDAKSGALRHRVHPVTGVLVPYCPNGAFPDVTADVPNTLWRDLNGLPWWDSHKYQIGLLTKRVRSLRIINMLTFHEVQINVCWEDTFYKIQERYSIFNKDPESYAWKYFDNDIELDKTMEENGIPDDRNEFTELGMALNYYVPVVFLFYKDDLKHYEEQNEKQIVAKKQDPNMFLSDDDLSLQPYRIYPTPFNPINVCTCSDDLDQSPSRVVSLEAPPEKEKSSKELLFLGI